MKCSNLTQPIVVAQRGVDPCNYLVDVLHCVDSHPASDVPALTPRVWKKHLAAKFLRSAFDPLVYAAVR